MIDFVNTLDTVSDVVLADKLIDRSISGAYNDDKIEKIGANAFQDCKNLTSVCFPVATSIGGGAFMGSGLKAITPETFPFVTTMGLYCSGTFASSALETVDWPSLTNDYGSMFANCTSLKKVNLPGLANSSGEMFRDCTSLTEVNLPAVTKLNNRDFYRCTALKTITLPCATNVVYQVFQGCTSLQVVDMHSCATIGGYLLFENCPIEALILRSTTMCTLDLQTNGALHTFRGSGIQKGTGYIYVPKALIDSYKAATNWSTYAAQIRAIEDYPDICGG